MEKTQEFKLGPVTLTITEDRTDPGHTAVHVSADNVAKKELREAALHLVYDAVSNATIHVDSANDRWTYRHHSRFKRGEMLDETLQVNPLDAGHPAEDVADLYDQITYRSARLSLQSNIEEALAQRARELQQRKAEQGYAAAPAPDGHVLDTHCNRIYTVSPKITR